MSKNIQIHTENETVFAGNKFSVKIVVDFDKPTKVRGIRAVFHGAERTEATYTTTRTDSDGNVHTDTHTAVEQVDIVKEELVLLGEQRKGFFGRIGDSMATMVGGGSHEVIEPGPQEFTIHLNIPENGLASFKGEKCSVFYRLEVSVDLPIVIDWSEKQEFTVVRAPIEYSKTNPVHAVFPDESGRSFWDKTFGKDVTLNLALDRDTMTVGEKSLAMLTVETPSPLKVDEMVVELVGEESSKAQGHTDSHLHRLVLGDIDSPNLISNESVHEFGVLIPNFDGPWSQAGANFDVKWRIEVRLKVPWAKDPIICVPVTILPPS